MIAKAKSSATLLLPGWDGAGVAEEDETTFSEMMTQVGFRLPSLFTTRLGVHYLYDIDNQR